MILYIVFLISVGIALVSKLAGFSIPGLQFISDPLTQKISLLVAILIFVWILIWLPFRRHEEAELKFQEEINKKDFELKKYLEKKPIEIEAVPLTAPSIDVFSCRCEMLLKHKNHQPVDGIGLRMMKIYPPLKNRRLAGVSTENVRLSALTFSPKDFQNNALKPNQAGRLDVFETSREYQELVIRFLGNTNDTSWGVIINEFSPEVASNSGEFPVFKEYTITFETTGTGPPTALTWFKISFSIDPKKPLVFLEKCGTKILDSI